MAFSDSLKVLLPDQGSLTGTWGTALNNQVFALLDSAIAGRVVIGGSDEWAAGTSITYTLSVTEGAANQYRAAIIHLQTNNSKPAGAVNIVVPNVSKAYIINNSLGLAANIAQISTSGASDANSVFVPAGAVAEVYCDGAGKISSAQNFVVDGVIENTTIGATTPSTGKFTTLEATGAATLVAGTINATTIGASTPSTGAFTTLVATSIGVASQGSGKFTTLEATGAATLVAGTINATTIGASTPSTGAFTTLEASGNIKSTAGTGQFYGAGSRDTNTVIGSATSPSSWTTDAVDTILIGKNAGEDITSGYSNLLIGRRAGLNVTTGAGNICIGSSAGGSSTDKGVISGNNNTIIGPQAGYLVAAATSRSVIIGSGTFSQETDLSDTVLIGTGSFGGASVERLKIDVNGCVVNDAIPVAGKVGVRLSTKTTTEIDSLSGMVQGELVYNTTTNKAMYYNGSGWSNI